jgi:hypothetical protein
MRASEEARAQKEKEAEKEREAQLKALRERQMRENVIPAKMRQQTNRDNPRN